MTDAFARKPLGGSNERRIESYRPRVAEVNALEKGLEGVSDGALRARSEEFKKRLADDKPVEDKPVDDMTVRTRRNEYDRHNRAAGVRARLKSASLAARPPAKGSKG
jgi:preprotein translocase subunit SecA